MKLIINILLIIMATANVNAATNEHGRVLQVKKISIADVELQDMPAHPALFWKAENPSLRFLSVMKLTEPSTRTSPMRFGSVPR